jgi:RNA polymerase sigma-70 factor (sigma-E family)
MRAVRPVRTRRVRPVMATEQPGRVSAEVALEELYAAHWRSLVRLSVLLVRDQGTAEEVVQDAYVALYRRWDRLRDHGQALAYLRQSVVNGSRSVLRRRGTAQRWLAREAGSVPRLEVATDPADANARRSAVLDAMAGLPERQREVLALRYYLDLSEAEIAEALGIAAGTVKSHASRGAEALRAALGPQLEELS